MSHHVSGRHRAPGRFNPLSEIAGIVAKSAQPAVKTSAVLAASGGLVASFAIPATAAPAEKTSNTAARTATAPVAVKAPEAAAPAAASAFGVIGFEATAKPKPKPKPRPVVVEEPAEPAPERTQAASRSTEREPVKTSSKPAAGGVLGIAASFVGTPYVYGGTTPDGFDCSGFTQYVFRQVGISLPRTSQQQMAAATPVSDPRPGDLVFLGPGHVGIYAGDGMMYDSPHSGSSVSYRKVYSSSATYGRP